MVINFLTKKSSSETLKNETITCKELAGELHKPIIKKIEKRKGNSPFINNIWGPDLADAQLISKFSKSFIMCY